MNPIVIIPARMASTRLPGKPLAEPDPTQQPVQVHCFPTDLFRNFRDPCQTAFERAQVKPRAADDDRQPPLAHRGGNLLLQNGAFLMRQGQPLVYQVTGSGRKAVAGRYVLLGREQAGFRLGRYDRTRPLALEDGQPEHAPCM